MSEHLYDAFISYASEDKVDVAEHLYTELTNQGKKIWYDKTELKVGDGLLNKIDEGLSKSKYGIVILSHNFFAKNWPKAELEGLFQKEIKYGKTILPVWHNLSEEDVLYYSPLLSNRLATKTENGMDTVVTELLNAMRGDSAQVKSFKEIHLNNSAFVSVNYKLLPGYTGEKHKYSLEVLCKNITQKMMNNYKCILYWPLCVPILKNVGLQELKTDKIQYTKFSIANEKKVFPGEAFTIISTDTNIMFEYEFNHIVFDAVDKKNVLVMLELYSDAHNKASTISKDIDTLNIF